MIKGKDRNIDWSTIFQADTNRFKKEILEAKIAKKKQIKDEVYNSLGGKCAICGIDDIRVLQVHHVNQSERTQKGTNYRVYLKEIQSASKLILLCCNCHRIETLKQLETYTSKKSD